MHFPCSGKPSSLRYPDSLPDRRPCQDKTDVKRQGRSRKTCDGYSKLKDETPNIFGLFVLAGTALGTKFVLLNLQRELPFSVPNDPPTRDQIQQTFFI